MKKQILGTKLLPLTILLLILIPIFGAAARPATINVANSDIQDFQLIDSGIGWVKVAGQLFWTEDNGTSWNKITPGTGALQGIYFLNNTDGYAVTINIQTSNYVSYILHTTNDAGDNWESAEIRTFPISDPLASSGGAYPFFIDESTGWVVIKQQTSSNFNIGTLYKTTNGGKTWQQLSIPTGEKVFFLDEKVGFTAGGLNDHLLYRSQNGGVSWEAFDPAPETTATLELPDFSTTDRGHLIVLENASRIRILESNDRGISWETATEMEIEDPTITFLHSLTSGQDSLITTGSQLITYSHTTQTFSTQTYPLPGALTNLSSNDADFIWGISTDTTCTEPGNPETCQSYQELVYSTDFGQSWRAIPTPIINEDIEIDSSFSIVPRTNVTDYPRTSLLRGQGFDMCEITNLTVLNNWKANSPYAAVNLYIGGIVQGCENANLSLEFVQALSVQGWKFIPTWVGHQASCTNFSQVMSSSPATAESQGRDNAIDAARNARKLGLGAADDSGTVIYYDLEAFDSSNTQCLEAAKAFINGWVEYLHSVGIMAGLYGSTCGSALAQFSTIENPPDVLWPAVWTNGEYNSNVGTYGLLCLSDSLWNQQERIRQYAGGHNEYWGGVGLNIDSNVIDGVVADISPYVGVPTSTLQNPSFETAALTPWEINQSSSDCTWQIPATADARTGSYALSMSKSATQPNCTGASQTLALNPTAGDLYRFAIWARSTTHADLRSVSLKIQGEGGAVESSNQQFTGIDDSWNCLEISHTIQNSTLSQLTAEVILENADGVEILLDDAHVSLNTGSLCPTVLLPSNLQASNGTYFDRINLTWDAVPDATYYKIYRSDTRDGPLSLIGQSASPSFSDVVGDFLDIYFYQVKACDAGKCSPFSNMDAGSFGTPLLAFTDDLESGEFVRWDQITNADKLSSCTSNPIAGTTSLCASVNTSTSTYLAQNLANPTNQLTVSFDFDPNDVNLNSRPVGIFQAADGSTVVLQLSLTYEAPNYKLLLHWYSGGTLLNSSGITIPNAPANYRITWNSSAVQARSANTFREVQLAINDVVQFTIPEVDNGGIQITKVILGVVPFSATPTGTGILIFDNFEYKGPLYIR